MTLELERASLRAWPALEEEVVGGWTCRFSRGFTGRANSVQSLTPGGGPLGERVTACERWYGERGRPSLFRITPFSEPGLDDFLAERGCASFNPTDVMLLDPREGPPEASHDNVVGECSELELTEWLDTYARLSGLEDPHPVMGEVISRVEARTLLGGVVSDDKLVACGLAVADEPYLGLFDLVVDPEQRRRGFGTRLIMELQAWGRTNDSPLTYLQVTRDNREAQSLYRKLGFRVVYEYHYRVPPR